MEEGGEGVFGVDEVGVRGLGVGMGNVFVVGGRVLESNFVDMSGFVGYDG